MLDFGWAELFVVMAVAILVVGPKDIPALMRGFGRIIRRVQYAKHAITQQFDEFMSVADIDELRDSVNFEAKPDGHEAFDEAGEDEDVMVPLPQNQEADDE